MTLKDCPEFVGRRLVIPTLPNVREARDVVFIPPGLGPQWGLFEPSGRAVAEAVPYTGAGGSLHHPQCSLACDDLLGAVPMSEHYDYVFIGNVEPHYGHFLIGPFARLWALGRCNKERVRIVFSCSMKMQELLDKDFFREMMGLLGLDEDNLLRVDTKVRMSRMLVAACPFEELSLVHKVFADMMNGLGRCVPRAGHGPRTRRKIYMSKERLAAGNVRVDNEAELTSILRTAGMDILFPEELGLRDQIDLWADDPVVLGFSGSALHTSVFHPKRTIITLAHGPQMWANQVLIDLANGNKARYLYDETGLLPVGPGNGFHMNFRIRDPARFADSLISVAGS